MSTSETPRTDNFYVNDLEKPSYEDAQSIEFARQLEKELTTAKASRDAWKKMAGELAENIKSKTPSPNCLCEESSEICWDCYYHTSDRALVAAYEKLLKEDEG